MKITLESVTPHNIDELTVREILDLIPEEPGLPPTLNRFKVIKMIYEILGFSLSNDALFTLLYESGPQLCLATAGGGKTTFAQIKIILEKIWRKSKCYDDALLTGENILCLVYNRHNIAQMERKQKSLIEKVNAMTPNSINLDDKVNACTMHSFCERWRKKYASKMGVLGFDTLTDTGSEMLLKSAINTLSAKYKDIKADKVNIDSLLSLYNYKVETLADYDELEETDKFYDVNLPLNYIIDVFKVYSRMKQLRRKYDFTDMLYSFYTLIKDDLEVRREIQSFYGYIVADEVQDFTPIMWEILKLLTDDGTPLLCIGDEDQNIYNFRGADIYDTLTFPEKFNGGNIFLLSRNRRCRKAILDVAKSTISKNTLRFNKSLTGVKSGGEVFYKPYVNTNGQFLSVLNILQKMSYAELEESVICYRERETSANLIEMLADEEIPFHVLSGYTPYTHEIYTHLFHIMDLLEMPLDPYCHLNLYKVLPVSKNDIYKVLQYDPKTHKFNGNENIKHFSRINYGNLVRIRGFSESIELLTEISNDIKTKPMKEYFNKVFNLFSTYYWEFKKSLNKTEEYDLLFESRALDLFNSDLTYKEFYDQFSYKKDIFKRNNTNQVGIAVSTFHGLKGLEYDTAFIINLDNSIFPNHYQIDKKEYPDYITTKLKESERRLFYVAVTRARDKLYLFYKSDNPSLYISELLGTSVNNVSTTKSELDDDLERLQLDDDLSLLNSFGDSDDSFSITEFEEPVTFSAKEIDEKFDITTNIDLPDMTDLSSDNKIDIAEPEKIILGDQLAGILQTTEVTTSELKKTDFSKLERNKVYKKSTDKYISKLIKFAGD